MGAAHERGVNRNEPSPQELPDRLRMHANGLVDWSLRVQVPGGGGVAAVPFRSSCKHAGTVVQPHRLAGTLSCHLVNSWWVAGRDEASKGFDRR